MQFELFNADNAVNNSHIPLNIPGSDKRAEHEITYQNNGIIICLPRSRLKIVSRCTYRFAARFIENRVSDTRYRLDGKNDERSTGLNNSAWNAEALLAATRARACRLMIQRRRFNQFPNLTFVRER